MSSINKKYYLGFTFEPGMSDGLHCTHCYFGTLSAPNLASVISVVDSYFETYMINMATADFVIPALFGPDKDIPVLLAKDPHVFEPMRDLREFMERKRLIGGGAFPFRPHVTTTLGQLSKPFYSYALIASGQVVREWKFKQ